MRLLLVFLIVLLQTGNAVTQQRELGTCLVPEEPYPYRLQKMDPLYEIAREEHQTYLEGMEFYIRCIDSERSDAVEQLKHSFQQFLQNFGKDAIFVYPTTKIPGE
ncbi:MAG: hypothetical protein QM488_18125 [Rhizobiaceae bacterium]